MPCGIMHDLMDADDTNPIRAGVNLETIRAGFRDQASDYSIKKTFMMR